MSLIRRLKNQAHRLIALLAVIRFGYPAKNLEVIGVTGTDGKTTTATIIYHLLKVAGYKVACVTTVAAFLGNEKINTGFHVTSPNPWLLQKLLRKVVDQGYTHLVLEVTSHGLDQFRVMGTNIQYAVITNVTHEHLDYHKNYAAYLKTKAKIFRHSKLTVLNRDDASYPKLKAMLQPEQKMVTYSLTMAGEWLPVIKQKFSEPYNMQNCLAAITLLTQFKLKKQVIREGLMSFEKVSGRQELIPNDRGLNLVVDFAHTPNGLENALQALKPQKPKKLVAVFGAAGLRDATKRPLMGNISSLLADEVILTSEDPRTEDPRLIIRDLKSGVNQNHGHVHSIVDRLEAIDFAVNHLAKVGDTVAFFGKGHEQAMNLDGVHEIPWSDQNAVRKVLA